MVTIASKRLLNCMYAQWLNQSVSLILLSMHQSIKIYCFFAPQNLNFEFCSASLSFSLSLPPDPTSPHDRSSPLARHLSFTILSSHSLISALSHLVSRPSSSTSLMSIDRYAVVSQCLEDVECPNQLSDFKTLKLNDVKFEMNWEDSAATAKTSIKWDSPSDCTTFLALLNKAFKSRAPPSTHQAQGSTVPTASPTDQAQTNHSTNTTTGAVTSQTTLNVGSLNVYSNPSNEAANSTKTYAEGRKGKKKLLTDGVFRVNGIAYVRHFSFTTSVCKFISEVVAGKLKPGVPLRHQLRREQVLSDLYVELEKKYNIKLTPSIVNGVDSMDVDTRRHQQLVRDCVMLTLNNGKHYTVRKSKGLRTPSECCRLLQQVSDVNIDHHRGQMHSSSPIHTLTWDCIVRL